jgi:hypothetical protein
MAKRNTMLACSAKHVFAGGELGSREYLVTSTGDVQQGGCMSLEDFRGHARSILGDGSAADAQLGGAKLGLFQYPHWCNSTTRLVYWNSVETKFISDLHAPRKCKCTRIDPTSNTEST